MTTYLHGIGLFQAENAMEQVTPIDGGAGPKMPRRVLWKCSAEVSEVLSRLYISCTAMRLQAEAADPH